MDSSGTSDDPKNLEVPRLGLLGPETGFTTSAAYLRMVTRRSTRLTVAKYLVKGAGVSDCQGAFSKIAPVYKLGKLK